MATVAHRLPMNAPGDLFVDESCIACDTCRRIAPGLYGGGEDDTAFVARQPSSASEVRRALMALVACPVSAIGSLGRRGTEVADAARAFPEELEYARGVYECGYAARSSYGAASWLLVRAGGNVLVDSPRFSPVLALRLRALGGVRFHFLSHRDDVADHARFREALGCERVLHVRDLSDDTRDVERPIEGDLPVELAPDLLVVPVPGHTRGSAVLLDGEGHLFTGDHLFGDEAGRLDASRAYCWYDFHEQTRSMERLLDHPFRFVFPGHGRPWRGKSPEEARRALEALVVRMRGE
jgi:glyoxylase-like metal-dependent hydrolase (beta-lactamase superfamily II)/ferredoxin